MGKRANIQATRHAAEAAARELRRQTEIAEELRRAGLTDEQRAAEDQATAALLEAQAQERAKDGALHRLFVGALLIFAIVMGSIALFGAAVTFVLMVLVIGAVVIYVHRSQTLAKQAAAAAAAAEQARRDDEAARRAQIEHHVRMLCAADPVFSALTDEWRRIPPTRPDDRSRNEAQQAERLVIIDEYAARFAELERTGQPVPDHITTMAELTAAERAWDSRDRPEAPQPQGRRIGIHPPQRAK